jgi:hypothetical protein
MVEEVIGVNSFRLSGLAECFSNSLRTDVRIARPVGQALGKVAGACNNYVNSFDQFQQLAIVVTPCGSRMAFHVTYRAVCSGQGFVLFQGVAPP